MAIALNSCFMLVSMETGEVLLRQSTPGEVTTIVGFRTAGLNSPSASTAGAVLIVGGKWGSMDEYEIADVFAAALQREGRAVGGACSRSGACRSFPVESGHVRAAWMSERGAMLAYADDRACRVCSRPVVAGSDPDPFDLRTLQCGAIVTSVWGSDDGDILAVGLCDSAVAVYCLATLAPLARIRCGADS